MTVISRLGLRLPGRRFTIFPKIIIALLVVIVPMDILNLLMNQSGVRTVRQEILQSSASSVHFYLSSLETEMNKS
ncbi:hypothetical protein GZH47_01730 [Paenibacillus rhizovicinus]|uniref:Uncharacterized protein n=1 Tax=Paenibacillus rhizovicinus TaxID=2704463 RepID=A0A6C0NYY0_9BACL|nr:hypothetical protein [Paenibacillus rhizovicinus]QHW29682.1 hypothetical protein GZH47_01730 [Paenibacillus rhizovicinus]